MALQLIIYSLATGRVRQVLDPGEECDEATLLALLPARSGEGATAYQKLGIGPDGKPQDHLHNWTAHVARITGKLPHPCHPETEAAVRAARPDVVRSDWDLHYVRDASGNTVGTVHADPGEQMPGYQLELAHDLQPVL